jgi:predicted lipid-binding transport protein (Tim44 family)
MTKAKKEHLKYCVLGVAAFFLLFIAMDTTAHARAGGGMSSGSRGFSSGGSYQRSTPTSPPRQPSQQPQAGATQPGPTQPSTGMGRGLLYGMGGLFLGGMLGSMLFGGHSQAAGWGGSGGFGMGDLIIILIILGAVYFIVKRFRAKREAMQASSAGGSYASSYTYDQPGGSTAHEEPQPQYQSEDNLSRGLRYIREMDPSFDEDAFRETAEDLFFRIQSAWTKRDLSSVRQLLSPDMLNTFQNDVNKYVADKQFNRLENIAVRRVEIVDAAQDRGEEYITVRFTASLLDYVVDESTSRVLSGSSMDPVKFLEFWTFSRKIGDKQWVLSGITQEGDYQNR